MSDRPPKRPRVDISAAQQRLGIVVLDPTHPAVVSEMRRVGDRFDPNRAWVHKNGQPYRLSDRVWTSGQAQRDQIDRLIKQSIASGADALKTAKQMEQYLNPELRPLRHPSGRLVRNQPKSIVTATPGRNGKGSYPARRLMRTEVTAAQAIAARDAAALNPFCETLGYNLSPQHPRADVCDPLAERDLGYGPGNYPIGDVPMPPRHPHCLCFLTVNVHRNVDAVVDALKYRYNLAEPSAADFVQPSQRALDSADRAMKQAINRAAQRLDQQIKQTANRAVQRAAAAEAPVTADLQAIGELTGGDLAGLSHRLKTAKSTARKLADDYASTPGSTLAQMDAKLFDNLRYTFVSDSAGYDVLVRETAAQLEARGYTRLRSKNFWEKGNGYAGVNDIWVTPQGQPFELQFHTPQSLYTKEKISHPLYEKLRVLPDGDPAKDLLQRQIDDAWSVLRAAEQGTGATVSLSADEFAALARNRALAEQAARAAAIEEEAAIAARAAAAAEELAAAQRAELVADRIARAEARIAADFPQIAVDMAGLPAELVADALEQFADLAAKYPRVAGNVRQFGSGELPFGSRAAASPTGDIMRLNPDEWNKPHFLFELADDARQGWVTTGDVRGLITHEFGHLVDVYAAGATDLSMTEVMAFFEQPGAGFVDGNLATLHRGFQETIAKADGLPSQYARTKPEEAFAEAFAQRERMPPNLWSDFTRDLDDFLRVTSDKPLYDRAQQIPFSQATQEQRDTANRRFKSLARTFHLEGY